MKKHLTLVSKVLRLFVKKRGQRSTKALCIWKKKKYSQISLKQLEIVITKQ